MSVSGFNYAEAARLIQMGRRAEKRGKAIQGFIVALLVSIFSALFGGWMFMLGVAVLAEHWWPALPTIGYWWSVLAVLLLRGTLSAAPSSSKKAQS